MLKLELPSGGAGCRILCLGSHSDDIEIGCGGTILRLLNNKQAASVHWVVFSADRKRSKEARKSANSFLKGLRNKKVVVKQFPDGFFPYRGDEIKRYFQRIRDEFSPQLIFTHYREDRHQDHRVISDLTWNTFRNHLILEYEIPKYDGDLCTPNVFVELDEQIRDRKIKLLMENFKTQRQKDWFSEQTFLSLMRLRGVESRASKNYAEAFHCRKMIVE